MACRHIFRLIHDLSARMACNDLYEKYIVTEHVDDVDSDLDYLVSALVTSSRGKMKRELGCDT